MAQTVVFTATDDNGSTTTSVTFPSVDAAASGPTWASVSTPATLTESTAIASITLSATGTGSVTYSDDGNLPPGLIRTFGSISGTPNTPNAMAQTVVFTATDDNGSTTTSVTFPSVDAASETLTFTTAAALGTKPGGAEIGIINIQATASQGSTITYSFTASDGFINITSNQISGIAPRLLNATSYTITGTATIAGPITNTQTFTILISASTPCLSPVTNICS
jgi:hypothetical protein